MNHGFARRLEELLPAGAVRTDEPMALHTTFKCGGPAEVLCEPSSIEEVQAVARLARQEGQRLYVIGCGSNLLVSDAGLEGVVMLLGPRFADIRIDGTCLHAQAGATNKQVADAALAAGLSGYEFASGIPGSIGGAAYMNAGAYDGEFKDVATSVTCLDTSGNLVTFEAADAGWGYRASRMQSEGLIVLEATLRLKQADRDEIAAVMDDLRQRRESKQPLELGSAGSTFKRPEGHFAGKLVQDAGMMGHRVGGAMVSTKHAGFVVNAGGATAADVLAVIHDVQDAVYERFGVRLEPEVRMWGFD